MAEPPIRIVDVAVVGAGPAGVAAALAAAAQGRGVALLDEGFRPGGQIWRHRPGAAPRAARKWLAALAASRIQVLERTSVFDAWRGDTAWRLAASGPEGRVDLAAGNLVLACGAREQFLPFPGWTLPGVLGAGGGQALLKEGLEVAGEPLLVAGSGPLLLPAAAAAVEHGARLWGVLEQAPLRRLAALAPLLAARPGKALQAMGLFRDLRGRSYRPGWWVAEAFGAERLEQVRVTDGRHSEQVPCRWLFCGFGLVPNLELAQLLGCAQEDGRVAADPAQRTSLPGVFAAGEVCGVAGVEAALAEGSIAGLAAAGAWNPEQAPGPGLVRARARARAFGSRLDAIFALRPELLALPRPDTLVCRCEDVPFGAVDPAWGARETKLCTRAGMGPCQGRVCGPILARHFGHAADGTVRLPVKAVPLEQLAVTHR